MTALRARSTSRLPVAVVGALVVVVLGAGLASAAVRITGDDDPATSTGASPSTPTTVAAEADRTPPTTSRPLPSEPEWITEIKAQVAELRGLEWKAPQPVEIISQDELIRRARAANARDIPPERLAGDGDTYKALHVIPRGLDFPQAMDDILPLILGFYDPETKELVVRDTDGEVDAQTKVTLAHELDHALTDQWFDFGGRTDALYDADDQERLDAFVALIEGDAKLLESLYTDRHLDEEEQIEQLLGSLLGDGGDYSAVLELPQFVLQELYFPYTTGLEFAERRQATGRGFAGLDETFRRPPTSTEQIIHPERYDTQRDWRAPDLPDIAGATSCTEVRRGTLGESTLTEVLDDNLDSDDAEAAITGWNGDSYRTVRCGRNLGIVLRIESDAEADAVRLAEALTRWAPGWAGSRSANDGRFSGSDGAGRLRRSGTRVDLVLADDAATADRLATAAGVA